MADGDEDFIGKIERELRALFDRARSVNELHFAMALMPESRGAQDPGWNTAHEASATFDEYLAFIDELKPGRMKIHVVLGFYCHLSEASGFYEVPKNMLRIAGGEGHVLWPFMHLVTTHAATGKRIAPNANRVLRDMCGHAESIGMHALAEVFRDAFDGDIRNGYAHADYVIWQDGLRLRKRNGGYPRIVSWDDFDKLMNQGINVFHILRQLIVEYQDSYDPPKTIRASLSGEPACDWTIFCDRAEGSFGITTGRRAGGT